MFLMDGDGDKIHSKCIKITNVVESHSVVCFNCIIFKINIFYKCSFLLHLFLFYSYINSLKITLNNIIIKFWLNIQIGILSAFIQGMFCR